MSVDSDVGGDDLLTRWVTQARPAGRLRRRPADGVGGLRFAFYGRVSTVDFQERESSRRWQRDAAEELIAGHGRIVVEYFDTSRSRRLSWPGRPQAAVLVDRFADPDRGFDAVVVGEYERAFCGTQLLSLLPQFEACGVQLWLPEAHGPLDLGDASHRALVMLLGAQSKREVLRARWRALQAMRGQARDEGRFLGGRPLYGYRLVDAGPHPNPMHAKWGRRLQRYDPDPVTAPTVRWIFAQRLTGRSVSSIAAELNSNGVPCPSRADAARNPHRAGTAWGLTTVRAILMNAKYTGRQVWNRQPAHHTPPHLPGPFKTQRWAATEQWVVSRQIAHPPLVSEQDFIAVQAVQALPAPRAGRHYQFVGLLRCRLCRRRLESCWSHGRPAYRCQHGHTSVKPRPSGRRRNLYVREDQLVELIRILLADGGTAARAALTPQQLADHLRQQRLVVTCGETRCSLDPAAPV
ncbi:recombinase family protein [Dactylosporangium sp. AC04546]|uniref:recombinase family protein n=1 Tax=Dactylosporangium sp. AC04546 TaxID=2862460 RepID=UPI001EDFC4AA|nr:recombinase family protein [Dactylosporangium sp. AC04546]WVK80482.1 recombinase family protein [Dactylosporangium sp. AC04546]